MISEVTFWTDTGFQEGGYEVPAGPDSLLAPAFVYAPERGIRPPRQNLFREMDLPLPFSDLRLYTYLRAVYENADGTQMVYYGWIDSVETSSTTTSANTAVMWHVDLWMTWVASCNWGSGVVLRRPATGILPPQPYPLRYRTVARSIPVTESKLGPLDVWWVIVSVSGKTGGDRVGTYLLTYPIVDANLEITVGGKATPTIQETVTGLWDEILEISPGNIHSVFLSPIPPGEAEFSGNALTMDGWTPLPSTTATRGALYQFSIRGTTEKTVDLGETIETTDIEQWVVRGFDGEIIGSLPYGFPVSVFRYRTVIGSVSGYIELRPDIDGHAEGMCFTVPLINLEITSNGTSTYNYSGARQADMDQIILSADQARAAGHLGVLNSAMSGVIGGAMAGNVAGAVVGGIGGAIANTVTTEAQYRLSTGEFLDRSMAINDYRAAHQENGLLMQGSGIDPVRHGLPGVTLARLDMDTYSADIRNADIATYGAHVSEPVSDCTEIIGEGGPLQIANLKVTGSVPGQARAYIKARFSGGLRIV